MAEFTLRHTAAERRGGAHPRRQLMLEAAGDGVRLVGEAGEIELSQRELEWVSDPAAPAALTYLRRQPAREEDRGGAPA
jgi:hypothetical protein